jgi:N-acetylglutamate synthase-like GNAT family acetyltransferase
LRAATDPAWGSNRNSELKEVVSITLRKITPADDAFLREVYASARAPELAMVPWSDDQKSAFLKFQFDAQDSHYRTEFPAAEFQLILNNDAPAGRLYLLRTADEIRIMDITILPEFRSQGIGTSVIKPLLDEATAGNKRVTIWAESFNPSQSLFRRLGFTLAQEDGFNHLLEFRPSAQNRTT